MQREERQFRGRHGETIRYDVYAPEAPTAVVVIAHGLGEHGRRYEHVARRFVDAGWLVAVPDHLGHGRSGGKRLRINSFGDYADDLDTVIDDVSVESLPTFLVGHSMGGCIALDYALDHQDRLDGLVLSGAAVVPGDDLSPIAIRAAKILGRVAPGLPTTGLPVDKISRDPDVVTAYNADPLVTVAKIPAGLGAWMLSTMESFPERLPSLQIPVLILHGSDDALTSPKGSEMVEKLAGSSDKTLVIYDDLYHEIFNEPEQDRVLSDVVDWISARASS